MLVVVLLEMEVLKIVYLETGDECGGLVGGDDD